MVSECVVPPAESVSWSPAPAACDRSPVVSPHTSLQLLFIVIAQTLCCSSVCQNHIRTLEFRKNWTSACVMAV